MKKYLFIALAALGFVACAEKGEENVPVQNGELEQSYVSITLASDDMGTRAKDELPDSNDDFDLGTEAERKVHSAHVFFFKDGIAFPVKFEDGTTTNAGTLNYISVNLGATTGSSDPINVSDIKNAVLVIQKYKGEYPNQMMVVLNWTPKNEPYSLSALQSEIASSVQETTGFVMSNSVYCNFNKQVVDAVAITENNIGKTEDEALDNPVTIYVERVAAKIAFSATNDGKFDTGETITVKNALDPDNGATETKVYAQIKGFELFNYYTDSYLVKRINKDWGGTQFGFTYWNHPEYFRSYWAISETKAFVNNTFKWNTDFAQVNEADLNKWVYCGENTNRDAANRSKVIVKAQLVDENDQPVEVANWYGNDYITEDKLKDVVANTLNHKYYSSTDGSHFVGITPDDLKCVRTEPGDDAADSYYVYFQLSTPGALKTWYKYEAGAYTPIEDDALDAELKNVEKALLYKNGRTYYWLDIKHFGAKDSDTEFGVVRNHLYKVNITGVKGFGTPVYDPTEDFIVPDKPEDIETYVSAQINILSWRVVADDYVLGE